ncbi:peptidoglycan-associated lipoprotein Pal [Phenylobacterium sp.]|uniref:peptidoglycan-associated lipoprotein Pal n=1 Tax=Phenylobacterium sp. TaxID=1871053 RepID=UPI001205C82C|nr:peptidoglycan-associated lipoprotein Pal [Phenylobacterium sp.]THD61309.1 MAG: peptidoglycan-associated lipoprotein Pal [Phenylobacterium sp.]
MAPRGPAFTRSFKPASAPVLAPLLAAVLAACASHPKPAPTVAAAAPPPPAPVARPRPAAPPPAPVTSNPLPGSERDFVVNVGDRVYFDLNGFAVRADAQPLLAAQAAWLARYPAVQVRIEGNCDERGTEEYNLALGARRANAVKAFLTAHGVSPARIATVSYGKEHPIDPGTGDEAWQHNRNGHTAIVSGARLGG